jgi:2-polyprenyl-6-hydroxyphenyl methylase/3-demethylubiquinone-9 3-methyltransferase
MKHIVTFDEYAEIEIKPSLQMGEYLRLVERDVKDFFIRANGLKPCACPGCGSVRIQSSFPRFGLRYAECADCRTLYVSPRPGDAAVEDFYRRSPARVFWREELSGRTLTRRKEKIIKPRFEWILDSTAEYLPGAAHLVDVNTDQFGYIEEMAVSPEFRRKTLFRPFLPPEMMRAKIEIVRERGEIEALAGRVDVITLFEVADRTADVDALFALVCTSLRGGGLCFMTDILVSGFNLQVLWDRAANVFPPDRLNVFSVEGLMALFARHDLECIEFSTPGILDVEIVRNAVKNDPEAALPRFIDYMVRQRNPDVLHNFQQFLQNNLLSSYGRVLLRKKS